MTLRLSFMLSSWYKPARSGLQWRAFSGTATHLSKPLPPRKVIQDEDIEENYLKGSGPGGQKINKTNSAVQLKHLPTGIVVKCQETRSRTQNRKLARRLLSDRLEEMELGESSRTALKRQAAAKKKASKAKKARRKYRKLDEEKQSVPCLAAETEGLEQAEGGSASGAVDMADQSREEWEPNLPRSK